MTRLGTVIVRAVGTARTGCAPHVAAPRRHGLDDLTTDHGIRSPRISRPIPAGIRSRLGLERSAMRAGPLWRVSVAPRTVHNAPRAPNALSANAPRGSPVSDGTNPAWLFALAAKYTRLALFPAPLKERPGAWGGESLHGRTWIIRMLGGPAHAGVRRGVVVLKRWQCDGQPFSVVGTSALCRTSVLSQRDAPGSFGAFGA